MIQELRWRGVARERQARGSFKGNDGESGGDKKNGVLAYESDCV